MKAGDHNLIMGRRPLLEALRAGRAIDRILVTGEARQELGREVLDHARAAGIPVQEVDKQRLDALAAGATHQGVAARAAAQEYTELKDLLARDDKDDKEPLLLVLDGLQDPQNLGSLLRTADGAGADGVVIPKRRAVGLTAGVSRASAGAVEHVPVARVTNLPRAMQEMQQAGLWLIGADMQGAAPYWEADLTVPLGLVVGGEGRGLGRLVREKCDLLVRIPMHGKIASLNAAVAGALMMYEAARQRREADRGSLPERD